MLNKNLTDFLTFSNACFKYWDVAIKLLLKLGLSFCVGKKSLVVSS